MTPLLWKSEDHGSGFGIGNCGDVFGCGFDLPWRLKFKCQSHMILVSVDNVGLKFEHASWVVKDEQTGAARGHLAIELYANTRVADIPAHSLERLTSSSKFNVKSRCNAARPIFEFADAFKVSHSCFSLLLSKQRQHAGTTGLPHYRLASHWISVFGSTASRGQSWILKETAWHVNSSTVL
jgi:hypothetical protein